MGADEELEDLVSFGDQTREFIQGAIGQYLLKRSKEEIDEALDGLRRVSPSAQVEIRRLQNVIARNEGVECWLSEIIEAGHEARGLLTGEEP